MIYFLQIADDQQHSNLRIKIGYATNWEARMLQHRASHLGHRLEVVDLCAVCGHRAQESKLHRCFSKYKWNDNEKEIFHPRPAVVDYIRWLRDQHFVWVPEETGTHPDNLEAVSASLWLPGEGRIKPPPKHEFLVLNHGPLSLPPRELTADDFYTSEKIIDCARNTLGNIDLDPASHALANSVVCASRFYTIADDGLSREWFGRVWLNPPFSQWKEWSDKVVAEWSSGRVDSMCVLAATRTLTAQYFSKVLEAAGAMCLFRGRIPFWGGHATSSPDDGHVVFYFGPDVPRFERCFCELGTVYQNPKALTRKAKSNGNRSSAEETAGTPVPEAAVE